MLCRAGEAGAVHKDYWLTDGLYGSFNCILYDDQKPQPLVSRICCLLLHQFLLPPTVLIPNQRLKSRVALFRRLLTRWACCRHS